MKLKLWNYTLKGLEIISEEVEEEMTSFSTVHKKESKKSAKYSDPQNTLTKKQNATESNEHRHRPLSRVEDDKKVSSTLPNKGDTNIFVFYHNEIVLIQRQTYRLYLKSVVER